MILIIDHDEEAKNVIVDTLSKNKFPYQICESGEDSYDFLENNSVIIDLIFLEVELSDISGFVITKKIKENSVLSKIPLVLMSKNFTYDKIETHKKLKSKADYYLIKPFTTDDIVECLSNLHLNSDISGETLVDMSSYSEEEIVALDIEDTNGGNSYSNNEVSSSKEENRGESEEKAIENADIDLMLEENDELPVEIPNETSEEFLIDEEKSDPSNEQQDSPPAETDEFAIELDMEQSQPAPAMKTEDKTIFPEEISNIDEKNETMEKAFLSTTDNIDPEVEELMADLKKSDLQAAEHLSTIEKEFPKEQQPSLSDKEELLELIQEYRTNLDLLENYLKN